MFIYSLHALKEEVDPVISQCNGSTIKIYMGGGVLRKENKTKF